jgi:hypothetical protein
MPTLTMSLVDLDGQPLDRGRAWVEVNAAALVDAAGDTVYVGRPEVDLSGLPDAPASVVLPATGSWKYRVVAAYVAAGATQRWASPWFDLTADADLADLIAGLT